MREKCHSGTAQDTFMPTSWQIHSLSVDEVVVYSFKIMSEVKD